jgi:hypothetical protein
MSLPLRWASSASVLGSSVCGEGRLMVWLVIVTSCRMMGLRFADLRQ